MYARGTAPSFRLFFFLFLLPSSELGGWGKFLYWVSRVDYPVLLFISEAFLALKNGAGVRNTVWETTFVYTYLREIISFWEGVVLPVCFVIFSQ